MKTIEERAKSYARKVWRGGVRDFVNHKKATELDFIAGAHSEREELLRWRNPQEELPFDGMEVLCKVQHPHRTYDVLRHDKFGWWKEAPGGGWCSAFWEVIAWRPILENE